ncbi:MAG TPA: tripartite tricarboxylate transporter substrate binding protein [Ramlibacter sp.]
MPQFLARCGRRAAIAALLVLGTAAQAAYPERPIRLVVGFPPGQATDVVARLAAKKLQDVLKQPVIVDNKPGAAGIVGAQEVMKSPADGYTLLVSSSGPLAVNPSLYSKLPYDPQKDFMPIAELTVLPLFFAVHPTSPAKSIADIIQQAKSRPGKLNYASAGNGVTSHLAMELFKHQSGVFMTHIPYRGSPPAVTDLIGGQVDAMIDTGPAIVPHAKSGKLRILAVTTRTRSPAVPEVPTMHEAGVKDFEATAWVAIMAPKGTPPEVVRALHKALSEVWLDADVKASVAAIGGEAVLGTPEQLQAKLASELKRWALAVKVSGAKVD